VRPGKRKRKGNRKRKRKRKRKRNRMAVECCAFYLEKLCALCGSSCPLRPGIWGAGVRERERETERERERETEREIEWQ